MRPLALAVLALVALAGFTGVARSAIQEGGLTRQQQLVQERSEQRAALQAERAAARQAHREARTKREEELEEKLAQRKVRDYGEDGHVVVKSECQTITASFTNFPAAGTRTLHETVTVLTGHGKQPIVVHPQYTFSGSEATQTIAMPVFLGRYLVDLEASWKGRHFDIGAMVNCGPTPVYTIEKEQRLGSLGEYTKGVLTGVVGETVEYAIIVRNTGNVPLTFSELGDPRCDAGTLSGGPGTEPVPPHASTTFTCSHTLTEADLAATRYTNVASIVAIPPEGAPLPTENSEEVVANVTASPSTGPPATPQPGTTHTGNALGGTLPSVASTTPTTGVLTFVQTTPPSLRGPQGCVRNTFKASLKAKGVATVSFYLDGHKLRTLSARSARRGLLSISLNVSRLKVGAHRLVAKVTMAKVASSGKQVRASRSLTFVHCASAAVRPKFTG